MVWTYFEQDSVILIRFSKPLELIISVKLILETKCAYDRDVWNLKNEDKVEIVYEPRRDNIVKKAVVEDTKPKSSWDKFTGGNKLGRQ